MRGRGQGSQQWRHCSRPELQQIRRQQEHQQHRQDLLQGQCAGNESRLTPPALLCLLPQVLRYGLGQQYKPHMDTLQDEVSGPRVCTVLMYLNGEHLVTPCHTAAWVCTWCWQLSKRVELLSGQPATGASAAPTANHLRAAWQQCGSRLHATWLLQTPCVAAMLTATDVVEGGETAFPDSNHWVDASQRERLGPVSPCARGALAFKPKKVGAAAGCVRTC